jgi:hypothetical protein
MQHYWEGQKDPTDNKRSGCPSTSHSNENIIQVHSLVHSDRRITVQMIADELQIGKTSVYSILTEDLKMRKICAKTAHSWAKVVKKTTLHWLENLRGKGCVLGEGHHRWRWQLQPNWQRCSKAWRKTTFKGASTNGNGGGASALRV